MSLGKTLGEQRGRERQYQVEIPASKKMPTNIALGNTLVVRESKIVGIKFSNFAFTILQNYTLLRKKNSIGFIN